MRPRHLLVIVLLLGLVAGACRGRVAVTAGVSTGGVFNLRSVEDQRLELARLAETGAHWVRLELAWDVVQPGGPDVWDWRGFDQMVRLAESEGYEVLATILWAPKWANGNGGRSKPPDDPGTFARFTAAAVRRYRAQGELGTHVRAWEIWNEPNHKPFWEGAPDARRYSELLRYAYVAAKGVDADSIIVSGGLAPNGDLGSNPGNPAHPVNFVKAMYRWGAGGFLDALGHHPYAPVPFAPLTGTPGAIGWNAFAYTTTLHDVMAANGDGAKQIWGTETGPATGFCSNCVDETTQSHWLAQEWLQWKAWSFAGPLFWHAGRDRATGTGDTESNYGLLRSDYSAKPAFVVAAAVW